jgi:hypothetical protein
MARDFHAQTRSRGGRTAGCLLLALLAVWAGGCGRDQQPTGPAAVRIGDAVWEVELALDEPTRTRGLGGREEVPPGTGMLFVFPSERPLGFYMKDCLVPLDIAYIGEDLTVLDIRRMSVEPDPSNPQVTYPSRFPAQYALEVAAGELEKAGVEPGDKVELLGAARTAATRAQ